MRKTRLLRYIVVVNMLLITAVNNAQIPVVSVVEDMLEDISVNNYDGEEIDWSSIINDLYEKIEQPINLNSATLDDLKIFPFLTPQQIENILAYIYIHGQMQSTSELMLVEDMDRNTIEYLLPFVQTKPVDNVHQPLLKTLLKNPKQELTTRFDIPLYKRKGYEDRYLGPALYQSLRYSFRSAERLYLGFIGEKDEGEPFAALHNKKGYDYYSIYLLIKNIGVLKTLLIGNYQLSFGQGLVLNSGFNLGKSAYLNTTFNNAPSIKKHSSTDEYNYFQGVATTIAVHNYVDVSAFYSHRRLDGSINEWGELTSIYKTGLHRTEKEHLKQRAVNMQLAGAHINSHVNNVRFGVTGIYYVMNKSYQPMLTGYRKYQINGNRFYNFGIDYAWRYRDFFLSGETAKGKKGYSTINRLHYELVNNYRFVLLHRYYSHDYWGMYSNSFSEGGAVQNENGWYLGAELSPIKYFNLFASLDLFSFPWMKYRISRPSQGIDTQWRLTYHPRLPLNIEVHYRFKKRDRDASGTQGATTLITQQHRLRLKANYLLNQLFQFRTTVDYNQFTEVGAKTSHGFRMTQSLAINMKRIPLHLYFQMSYFNTGDYDSRVYITERQMLYAFYTPSFYGHGGRWMAYARCDFNKQWMAMIKMAQTIYFDRAMIGSGHDLISSYQKADVQMLLCVKF